MSIAQADISVEIARLMRDSSRVLRHALLDGRLSAISHAMTVSIALLTTLRWFSIQLAVHTEH